MRVPVHLVYARYRFKVKCERSTVAELRVVVVVVVFVAASPTVTVFTRAVW